MPRAGAGAVPRLRKERGATVRDREGGTDARAGGTDRGRKFIILYLANLIANIRPISLCPPPGLYGREGGFFASGARIGTKYQPPFGTNVVRS